MVNPFKKETKKEVKKEIRPEEIESVVDSMFKEPETWTPVEESIPQQNTIPENKTVPEKKKTVFKKEKEKHVSKKPDRDNMKSVEVVTEKSRIDWNRALLWLSVLGIVGIIFLYQMVSDYNAGLGLLLWLFGMMCFLPLGFILGWFFLDPYMRCKIMRRTRHKNYGLIYFVHKGGKRLSTRIKNLDDDVIISDTKMWLIDKGGVYYLDIDGNKIEHASIDEDNVATLPSNVPALFLDPETMIPLRFHEEKSQTNPQQAGAILLGYINNQITKNLFFKKQMTMFYIILIALTGITFVIALQLYNDFTELKEMLPNLEQELTRIRTLIEGAGLIP